MANQFRPGRYGGLLQGPLLPARAPPGISRVLWEELRDLQRFYQEQPEWRRYAARDFSKLVRALHGGRLPVFVKDRPRFLLPVPRR